MIETETGISSKRVNYMVKGYHEQIRHYNTDTAAAMLIQMLPILAKDYGARFDISLEVLTECGQLVKQEFSFLSFDEIRKAYREWAAGLLMIPGAEMWGGEFNANQLGKVLTAYCENRKKVIAKFIKIRDEVLKAEEQEQRAKEQQAKFEIEFPQKMIEARETITRWEEVQEWWFKPLWMRKWIILEPGEADDIMKEATALAVIERQNRILETRGQRWASSLQAAIPGETDLAKIIARKLTIFKKVIQAPDWEPVDQSKK